MKNYQINKKRTDSCSPKLNLKLLVTIQLSCHSERGMGFRMLGSEESNIIKENCTIAVEILRSQAPSE